MASDENTEPITFQRALEIYENIFNVSGVMEEAQLICTYPDKEAIEFDIENAPAIMLSSDKLYYSDKLDKDFGIKAKEILQTFGKEAYLTFTESIWKVANESWNFTEKVIENSISVLNRIGKNDRLTADLFLIESIYDKSDAEIVSQVIDMSKYKDAYNEKVQQFY